MTVQDGAVSDELEPVFLEIGKALFICQAFEGTLVLLLSLISRKEADGNDEAYSAALDLYSQKTLGQLLKRLGEKIELPFEIQALLSTGWESRNTIVHRFVHENILAFGNPKGRLEVEALLVKHKLNVKTADIVANRLLDRYLAVFGITVDDLKRNADRMWEHLNPTAPSDAAERH